MEDALDAMVMVDEPSRIIIGSDDPSRTTTKSRQSLARGRVLLLVDDEPDILESVQFLLEKAIPGLHVILANSGHQALEILQRQRVHLILSDFKMPVMDGLEFLIKARKALPDVPRILFTAYADDQQLGRLARSEALVSALLSKTIDPQALVTAVEQHLP